MSLSSATPLIAGFADPVRDAQSAFRAALSAMAEPGTILDLAGPMEFPVGLHPTTASLLLALADYETPIWLAPSLRSDAVSGYLRFHTGAPIVDDCASATFGVIGHAGEFHGLEGFSIGSLTFPDRGATLILQIDCLLDNGPLTLTGPGIAGSRSLGMSPVPEHLPDAVALNRSLFPRGVDFFLTTPNQLAALPRSTRLVAN